VSKYGRSRKEQNMDRKDKHKEYEQRVSSDASEWFKRPAYLPRHTVTSYLESKGHDVKGVIADGQSEGT
jgi:hypothetical protein